MDGDAQQTRPLSPLTICIQIGAILASWFCTFPGFGRCWLGMLGRDKDGLKLWSICLLPFFPAAIIGLLFNRWIRTFVWHVCRSPVSLFVESLDPSAINSDEREQMTIRGKT